ncbi:hypothetical protein LMG33818_001370 [Halomonadaceae bacterium LMG 33818]
MLSLIGPIFYAFWCSTSCLLLTQMAESSFCERFWLQFELSPPRIDALNIGPHSGAKHFFQISAETQVGAYDLD